MRTVSLILAVALLVSGALAAPVAGAQRKTTIVSSLALVMTNDANANGLPDYADTITWAVQTNATSVPDVRVKCYQGTTRVYYAQAGYYAGYLWPDYKFMTLASMAWTGGAASCTAELFYWQRKGKRYVDKVLLTKSFAVGA